MLQEVLVQPQFTCKKKGAYVIAQCSKSKFKEIINIGADETIDRNDDLAQNGTNNLDVIVDLVTGEQWKQLLEILKPGGRYVAAGAIAGPIVELDVRTLYLKDLTLYGCTHQPIEVFKNLIKYIENDEIKPLVAPFL